MAELSHIDEKGRAKMVDVSDKDVTVRTARARGLVRMQPETLAKIMEGSVPKGDVLAVARTAGIMAAKRTPDLIPLCHPLPLSAVEVSFAQEAAGVLRVEAAVSVRARTGAEMEALTAVSVAALTVYDMCKAVEKGISIDEIVLLEKTGGRSGTYKRG